MIDYFSLGHPLAKVRSRYALAARKRMFRIFVDALQPSAQARVLDLGVTPDTSLPESNFFEKLYPHPRQITAASIEDASNIQTTFPGVSFKQIGTGRLPFEDNEFDIVFCSAVIEHVGNRSSQAYFVSEALRVSKCFFFTTPHRGFPLEFHTLLPFIHWLPQRWHQQLLKWMGKSFWARTENLNLLTPRSFRQLMPDCQDLTIRSLRLFGWPSNIVVYGRS